MPINNRFLSLYDYNFLLVIEKIMKRNSKICGSRRIPVEENVGKEGNDVMLPEKMKS